MSETVATIIVGAMAMLGTLGGSWLGVRQSNKLVNYRIDRLEKKVEKYNNLVDRMYAVEGKAKTNSTRIDAAFMRIDDLKEDVGEVKEELEETK